MVGAGESQSTNDDTKNTNLRQRNIQYKLENALNLIEEEKHADNSKIKDQ